MSPRLLSHERRYSSKQVIVNYTRSKSGLMNCQTFNKFESRQSELELSDDTDHSADRQQFEDQYFEVKAKFNELLCPILNRNTYLQSSPRTSLSGNTNQSPRSHSSSAHIKLPTIPLPTFGGDTCRWLHFRDTFEALIVHNTALSNVQKFHYLVASLKRMRPRI